MHLGNGKTLHIVADGLSPQNGFVRSVALNGKPLDRTYLTHEQLMAGGELRFSMSSQKEASWANRSPAPPYSFDMQP